MHSCTTKRSFSIVLHSICQSEKFGVPSLWGCLQTKPQIFWFTLIEWRKYIPLILILIDTYNNFVLYSHFQFSVFKDNLQNEIKKNKLKRVKKKKKKRIAR